MLWIDSVRSLAYQTPNTTARRTANTRRAEPERDAVLVGEDVGVERAGHAEDDDRQPVRERDVPRRLSCQKSTAAKHTVKINEVLTNPTPRSTLIQSAKLSPTVVHRILMIQNQMVTSGTLLSNARVLEDAPGRIVAVDMNRIVNGGVHHPTIGWFARRVNPPAGLILTER